MCVYIDDHLEHEKLALLNPILILGVSSLENLSSFGIPTWLVASDLEGLHRNFAETITDSCDQHTRSELRAPELNRLAQINQTPAS